MFATEFYGLIDGVNIRKKLTIKWNSIPIFNIQNGENHELQYIV